MLVDPKKVELTLYGKLERHFLAKLPGEDDAIITDTHKVIYTLNSLCIEMDARYDLLRKAEVRHVKEYNDKFRHRKLNPQKGHRFLPYIIVVIDEFADLIMTAGREVETPIARIAATRLDDAALPVRLYYSQKVFRSVSGDHGHKGEFLQVGAEFIGADGLEADKDILTAAFAALSKTGADNFRVELGHAELNKISFSKAVIPLSK